MLEVALVLLGLFLLVTAFPLTLLLVLLFHLPFALYLAQMALGLVFTLAGLLFAVFHSPHPSPVANPPVIHIPSLAPLSPPTA
jgi:hypothetical protein